MLRPRGRQPRTQLLGQADFPLRLDRALPLRQSCRRGGYALCDKDICVITSPHDWLLRGGETGCLIATRDWSGTSLGPLDNWPPSLKTALGLLLLSPVPIVMLWGKEGVMLYNDAYSVFAGGRHPELLGSKVLEGWPEVADFNDNVMKVGLAGGTLQYKDQELTLYRHGAAEQVWMNLDYSPVLDESGEPAGVIAVVVETSERVRADRRLMSERERLFQAFEQVPGFIIAMRGPEHRVEFVNAAHRRAFTSDHWVGKTIREAFPDIEGQGFFEMLDRVFATGERFDAVAEPVRFRQPNGLEQERNLTFVYEAMRDSDGSIVGILCEGSDVTDAHRAEQDIRDERRALQALNRVAATITGETDVDRIVQHVVDAGVGLTGAGFGAFFYNVTNSDGESYMLYSLSGAPRSAFEQYPMPRNTAVFAPTFDGEGVVRSDDIKLDPRYGHNAPNQGMPKGHLPVTSYLAVPVFARDRTVLGGLFFGHPEPARFTAKHEAQLVALASQAAVAMDNADLIRRVREANETLERRVEERSAELVEAHEALRQAQKMEAVGQLTGGIAHDFNNLLAGISGSLEVIERRIGQGTTDGIDRFLSGARDSAQRAAALTQRLLAFSRRQTLDPKPTDVNRLVGGMEELIRRTVGPAISVEVAGAEGLWPARVDAAQLESALLNLAINARDAMPDGGRIVIQTANQMLDAREGRERNLPAGHYLSICVTDSGTGIPQDIVDRIFDPFFTTKPIGQGTGLGLSMIHGFVRQSGGQIRVQSEEGRGTTMCMYLPRYLGALEENPAAADPTIEASGTGETVLVIDDEPTVRMLIVDVLEEAGYRALEAEDGPSGLDILQSDARIDLLVTDVGLPGGMNGRQIADAARVARPDLKVLFVTGFAEHAAVGDGHLEPGMAVITKPFAMADLAGRISTMIEGG
jgi:signal transduction histidine kinase/PAS domain-containing protein